MSSTALVEELNPEHAPTTLQAVAPSAVQLMLKLEDAGLLTPRALRLPDDISYDKCDALGAFLGELKSRGNFYLGDWLIEVEQRFPEEFAQAAESTGLSEQTNLRVMAVCRNVPSSRRRDVLSWSCHAAVQSLDAREQKAWLDRAAKSNWGFKELRSAMQAARHDEKPQLPGTEPGEPDAELLLDAARALVAHAEIAGENVIVRVEDFTRVKAALGVE